LSEDFITRTKEIKRDAKDYRYVSFSDDGTGTTQAVWTPSPGKAVRTALIIVSADSACKVELRFGTDTFTHLEFESRKTHPIFLPYDVKGPADTPINAYLLSDAGTTTVYITIIGEEE